MCVEDAKNVRYQKFALTEAMNLSVSAHLEPKLFACRVMFSLVCESNVGLLIRQLMKIHK